MLVFSKSKSANLLCSYQVYWKNAFKRCFSTQGWQHLKSKFLSRQAYQNAANHVFEKRKDNCFRNYEVLLVLIKYNGIIRNDIGENIKFYRVVRVIPPIILCLNL